MKDCYGQETEREFDKVVMMTIEIEKIKAKERGHLRKTAGIVMIHRKGTASQIISVVSVDHSENVTELADIMLGSGMFEYITTIQPAVGRTVESTQEALDAAIKAGAPSVSESGAMSLLYVHSKHISGEERKTPLEYRDENFWPMEYDFIELGEAQQQQEQNNGSRGVN